VADLGEQLVGFAEVSIRHDHVVGTSSAPVPYLEGWYVRAAHRGHGIGRGLLDFAESWVTSRGFGEIASDAEVQNSRSIRLHRSPGFTEVERSVHFVKKLASKDA
jgi:aminoglycoside 6'-N-acetyltransferase I